MPYVEVKILEGTERLHKITKTFLKSVTPSYTYPMIFGKFM